MNRKTGGASMSNKSILISLQKGDIDSFEWLVNSYEKRIFYFIYSMVHNHDIAQDLTQDSYVKIYKNLYKFNPDYPIEPWIYRITYNVVLDFIKKNKNSLQEISLSSCINYIKENDADSSLSDIEFKDMLQRELQSLKPDTRMIIILRAVNDLSFEQIALILNKSVPSVKLKFYRNRKIFIQNLEKYIKEGIK